MEGEIIRAQKLSPESLDRPYPTHFFFYFDYFCQSWNIGIMIHDLSPFRELL